MSDVLVHPLAPERAWTRLQIGTIKPIKLYDGMIRYGNFLSTGKPQNLEEALGDKGRKESMDVEYSALMKNQHLVPHIKVKW